MKHPRKFEPNAPVYYPTATFELFHVTKAVNVVALLQLCLAFALIMLYFGLEARGYFYQINYFRSILAAVATVYLIGISSAVLGVFWEKRTLLSIQITILKSIMLCTDLMALCIVLIMAIGNRQKDIESIPSHFLNQKKFYKLLGPFWMYLGAIFMHISVAGNMIFLKVINNCAQFLRDKEAATLN